MSYACLTPQHRGVETAHRLRHAFFTLMVVGSCVLSGSLALSVAHAAAPKAKVQAPGYFRTTVGDFEVTALYDGGLALGPDLLTGKAEEISALIDTDFPSAPPAFDGSVSGFLVNTGKQLILVDTGAGRVAGIPTLGKLAANLRAAGYKPEQVDQVLITHMHFDHVGGLLAADGQRAFPNAVVRAHKADSDFWLSKETAASAPKAMQDFFRMAQVSVAPYVKAGRWKPFAGEIEFAPGVRAVALPGHTPGHTGLAFESKGNRMLVWGDTLHVAPVQFPKPDIGIVFDVDPKVAIEQRLRLMAGLADDKTVVAAAHVAFPGMGRLRKLEGGGYAWVPVRYVAETQAKSPALAKKQAG